MIEFVTSRIPTLLTEPFDIEVLEWIGTTSISAKNSSSPVQSLARPDRHGVAAIAVLTKLVGFLVGIGRESLKFGEMLRKL